MSEDFLKDPSLLKLFLQELELHLDSLSDDLLAFEKGGSSPALVESLMRASHSIKGAARVLGLKVIEEVAHAMEDCFLSVQGGNLAVGKEHFDFYFQAADSLGRLLGGGIGGFPAIFEKESHALQEIAKGLRTLLAGGSVSFVNSGRSASAPSGAHDKGVEKSSGDASIRVSAQYLTRVMALAAESLVETSRLDPFADSLVRIKDNQEHLIGSLSTLSQLVPSGGGSDAAHALLRELRHQEVDNLDLIRTLREQVYLYSSRNFILSDQLYQEVLAGRMRPLSDILKGFPRMVRDLSRSLNKNIDWVCAGGETSVDRDSLEQLEAPLTHLVRNACDHGIEPLDVRERLGKPQAGVVIVSAGHRGGMLVVEVSDDGAGVDPEKVRARVVESGLLKPDRAQELPLRELFDFMFLPGFSTSPSVSKVSGRGVGLDVVKEVVQSLGGSIEVQSTLGEGTTFSMRLPVTRSVVRTLVVQVGEELYALPLSQVVGVLSGKSDVEVEGPRQHICARELFQVKSEVDASDMASYILLEDDFKEYVLEVDAIIGEATLLVFPLDARLGKVPGISAASQNEAGDIVLIIDVPDLLYVVSHTEVSNGVMDVSPECHVQRMGKRVLIVDDSVTVREAESIMLRAMGCTVEVAVDGIDAWEAISSEAFDLIITDLDMPRMGGFELLSKIKRDPRYASMPVIVLSYKDRPEDRDRAEELGAFCYISKSEFEDGRLQACVHEVFDK